MELNPIPLKGNWEKGWALDLNTIRQDTKENDLVLVKRTEIGEHLYQLKYFDNTKEVETLGDAAADFIMENIMKFGVSVIIPVPPSKLDRSFQPVFKLAEYLGKKLGIGIDFDYLLKTEHTPQLLNIKEGSRRKEILDGIFKVKDDRYQGKGVLLFDDLYSSGETLKAVTSTLLAEGGVADVFVLTIAKTRVNR
ncbi:MAG: ComF family protein [Actinomycetota bacterium]